MSSRALRVLAASVLLLLPLGHAAAEEASIVRQRAFELLNEGVAAYTRGDYPAAVDKLRESASLALNSFRAHYYLGLALIADRRYAEAVTPLEVALDLDPKHLQSLVALGDAKLRMGDAPEARAAYLQALKLQPQFAEALDGIARTYEAQGKEVEAIEHFRRAIAANRGFAPSYAHLGDLYLRQDRLEDAIPLLEEAVSVRPDFAPGLNRLAVAYGRLGFENEALATIQRAIELEPKTPLHRATQGDLQLAQGFPRAAEKSYREALALDAALPEARLGLAELARRRGDYDSALAELQSAIDDSRTDSLWSRRLTGFRDRLVAEREDARALETAADEGTASPEQAARLAEIFAGRRRWEQAVALQRGAPDTREHRVRLAYMLFQAGRYREAHEVYEALRRESPDATLAVNAGVSLALLGDDVAAVEAYRAALESDPESLPARLYLGNALLRLGREREAAESYRAYLDRQDEGEAAERVRRILRRIAPDLAPPVVAPQATPAPPPEAES